MGEPGKTSQPPAKPTVGKIVGEVRLVESQGKREIRIDATSIDFPTDVLEIIEKDGIMHLQGEDGKNFTIEVIGRLVEVSPLTDTIGSAVMPPVQSAQQQNPVVSGMIPPALQQNTPAAVPATPARAPAAGEPSPAVAKASAPLKMMTNPSDLGLVNLRSEFNVDEVDAEVPALNQEELGLVEKVLMRAMRRQDPAVPAAKGPDLAKLRKMSLENLAKVGQIYDRRDAIAGIGYVLKQFLQVRFNISQELTYSELVDRLNDAAISDDLKKPLMKFFMNLSNVAYASDDYAKGISEENFPGIYDMTKHVILDLT